MTMTMQTQTHDDAATMPRMTRGGAQAMIQRMMQAATGKIPLREVQAKIEACAPFESGTMRGSRGPDGGYTVWSYHEPIGGKTGAGVWWRSVERFSQTTSKHQNVLARAIEALGVEEVQTRG